MAEKISSVIKKMIEFSNGNLHDISHFLKVWSFSRNIGESENLDERTLYTLELAAIVHDIACPLCREKYGNTNGKYQEIEGVALVHEFFSELDISKEIVERVSYLVSHHHTYTNVIGLDYQILLEADFLVNADEENRTKDSIINTCKEIYKTETGKKLLSEMYLV